MIKIPCRRFISKFICFLAEPSSLFEFPPFNDRRQMTLLRKQHLETLPILSFPDDPPRGGRGGRAPSGLRQGRQHGRVTRARAEVKKRARDADGRGRGHAQGRARRTGGGDKEAAAEVTKSTVARFSLISAKRGQKKIWSQRGTAPTKTAPPTWSHREEYFAAKSVCDQGTQDVEQKKQAGRKCCAEKNMVVTIRCVARLAKKKKRGKRKRGVKAV